MRALVTMLVVIGLSILVVPTLHGQAVGDFRSHASGNWSDVTAWNRYDGGSWAYPAPFAPTGSEFVTIQSTDSITVDVPLSVTGTLKNFGKVGGWANLTFASGGAYVHAQNAGEIPICSWSAGSTCFVTGVIDTAPAWTNQSFYNFVWNCPAQTANLNLGWDDGSVVLHGTLSVLNTNWSRGSTTTPTPQLRLFADTGSCTIEGDLIVSGRNAALSAMGSHYPDTITIKGNIVVSGNSVLSLSNNSAGVGLWYLKGNFSSPDTGTLSKSNSGNTSKIIFSSSGSQSFSLPTSGMFTFAGAPNFEVLPGTTLVLATDRDIISGAGSFRLDSSATLVIGNSKGINTAVGCSGSNGGGNLLSKTANYVYQGSVAQMAGTKLPSTVAGLTINNAAGVTLEEPDTVTGTLFLQQGKFTLGDHGLTVNHINGASSSNYVYTDKSGTLTYRNVGSTDVLFPVGTASSYLPVTLNNTGTVDDFSVIVKNTFTYPPGSTAVVNAQWTLTERTSGANAAVTMQWNTANEGAAFIRGNPVAVDRYTGSGWDQRPATIVDLGNGSYTASASGYSAFTIFVLANVGVLPVQIASFSALAIGGAGVRLDWKTLSEIDNYGFVVERSSDLKQPFVPVSTLIPGHGTTLVPHEYSYTDSNHVTGSWYYRLRQIDLDSTMHYSETVLVSVVTGVTNPEPLAFGLKQNYPNPFNPTTTIRYTVGGVKDQASGVSNVRLAVYDLLGREVAVVVDERQMPGEHEVRFDGRSLASGMYFCRLTAAGYTAVRKMTLMK